jgi:zinc protease
MINRTIAPNIKQTAELDLKLFEPEMATLDNGIEVCLINTGTQDVLMLDFDFVAGSSIENKNLLSGCVSHLLKCGTTTKTSYQLNEALEYYGAYLNRGAGAEKANITLHTLTKHLESLLPLVADVIYNSTMPDDELQIFKTQRIQQLKMSLQKGDFVANRLIDIYLYGEEHPYGRISTEADYLAITQQDCMDFYKKYYQENICRIYVGGKLPTNIKELLNQYFGKTKIENPITEPPQFEAKPATQKKYVVHNDANAVQGAIRLARPFYNRHHPDFMECMVVNSLFGGYFGSRLMSNIREDKGYTYGIHSYIQNHVQQTAWMISTETGKDVTPAAIAEVYKEMEILKTTLVDEEELQLVKNYMAGQILGDLDGPFQILNRWKTYYNNNLTSQYFYDYIKVIKSITPHQIQDLAKKYLNENDFYELVVY